MSDSFTYWTDTGAEAQVTIYLPRVFRVGKPTDPPIKGKGGLALMGGGDPVKTIEWMMRQTNGGDFVIVDFYGDSNSYVYQIWDQLGGRGDKDVALKLNSVSVVMVTSAQDANNDALVQVVKEAETILIAGGDQWNYINHWDGTKLDTELQAALNSTTRCVGGSSAGLAVMGETDYSARRGVSVMSEEAINDPFNQYITFNQELTSTTEVAIDPYGPNWEKNLLQAPQLAGVITDTHFAARDRGGRLMAFMARTGFKGLAVDEHTGVVVQEDGPLKGQAWVLGPGYSYFARRPPERPGEADVVALGVPLTYQAEVRRIGEAVGTTFAFAGAWAAEADPVANIRFFVVEANNGVMVLPWKYTG
jgi:cyanophycinase-like exopeptidase